MFWFSGFPWLSGLSIKAQNSKVLIAKLFKDWGEMEKRKIFTAEINWKNLWNPRGGTELLCCSVVGFSCAAPSATRFSMSKFLCGERLKNKSQPGFWCSLVRTNPHCTCIHLPSEYWVNTSLQRINFDQCWEFPTEDDDEDEFDWLACFSTKAVNSPQFPFIGSNGNALVFQARAKHNIQFLSWRRMFYRNPNFTFIELIPGIRHNFFKRAWFNENACDEDMERGDKWQEQWGGGGGIGKTRLICDTAIVLPSH